MDRRTLPRSSKPSSFTFTAWPSFTTSEGLLTRCGASSNVDEAVLGAEEVHEGAEVHDLHDLAVIDLADFRLGNDTLDPFERSLDRLAVGGGDLHRAVVF